MDTKLAGWQPIHTAPKFGRRILVLSDEGNVAIGRYVTTSSWDITTQDRDADVEVITRRRVDREYFDPDPVEVYYPAYWMPLPDVTPPPPEPSEVIAAGRSGGQATEPAAGNGQPPAVTPDAEEGPTAGLRPNPWVVG